MRVWLALIATIFLSQAAASHELVVRRFERPDIMNMRPLPVHVGGRVIRTPLQDGPRGALRFTHEWPGIYWEANFRSENLLLAFDDTANEYRLLIDDKPPIALVQPGRAFYRVSGTGPGVHSVRLEKVSESIGLVGRFDGFYISQKDTALPVASRRRQIEFIGPSGMTGYGTRSTKRTCDLEEVRVSTDTQRAFPALVAKHYNADYQINAISGRGLIRNIDGSMPGQGLARVYPYALLEDRVPYVDQSWHPQIILTQAIVDFVGDIKPGEAWVDQDALASAYFDAMTRFIGELHHRSPDAAIILTWIDPATQADPAAKRMLTDGRIRIEAAAKQIGVRALDFMIQPTDLKLEMTGCNYHGNLRDQQIFANWTIAYLDRHPEWWQGR
jgi:hypothetical protein